MEAAKVNAGTDWGRCVGCGTSGSGPDEDLRALGSRCYRCRREAGRRGGAKLPKVCPCCERPLSVAEERFQSMLRGKLRPKTRKMDVCYSCKIRVVIHRLNPKTTFPKEISADRAPQPDSTEKP